MKHTPGPWEVYDAPNQHIESVVNSICAPLGEASLQLVACLPIGSNNSVANTKLIAAAPDLLEVLTRALDYIAIEGVPGGAEDIYEQGKQAIAKTE